eukprot:3860428-Prymnesium_polylepis.1
MVSAAAHLATPSPHGGPPDLSEPIPGGGPRALELLRLVNSYSAFVLGFFLYFDTFFEYLKCRD